MNHATPAREHKDRLFKALFGDEKNKRNTLELYNAVNNSCYTNEDDITLTMIDDAIYLGMKNDVSFLIADTIQLYEHQSTVNPNMPLRGLMYFGKLYAKYLEEHPSMRIYGSRLLRLPTPRFVVFYNGTAEQADRYEMRLTDAFQYPEQSCIEVTAELININYGHNRELMEKSKTLYGYAYLVSMIRRFEKDADTASAVNKAVDRCIKEGILTEYLSGHKTEVVGMLTKEYSEKEVAEMFFEDGLEQGLEKGREEGLEKGREEGRMLGREELLASLLSQGILTEEQAAGYRTMNP